MNKAALFDLGAVAVAPPQLIEEGKVLTPVWADGVDPPDGCSVVSLKGIRMERVHKPEAHLMRARYHGGWVILPYEHVGAAVSWLARWVLDQTGSRQPTIRIEPITREEIQAMRESFGGGER